MRVYTYLIIMVGLMMIFYLAGITTTTGRIITAMHIFDIENFSFGEFFDSAATIFGGIIAAGITIGAIYAGKPEIILLLGYAVVLLAFVGDLIGIVTYMNSNYGGWLASVVGLIIAPLAVGYVHSVISWWGGRA